MDADLARRLRLAASAVPRSTGKRDRLIIEAYESGAALRAIAREVGMAHPSVRHIILRDRGTLAR